MKNEQITLPKETMFFFLMTANAKWDYETEFQPRELLFLSQE